MKLEQALILAEDTPQNYIRSLIKELDKVAQIHSKFNFVDINNHKKEVETTRIEKDTGRKLSNEEFDKIALNYFDKTYPQRKEQRQTIINALLNYHV